MSGIGPATIAKLRIARLHGFWPGVPFRKLSLVIARGLMRYDKVTKRYVLADAGARFLDDLDAKERERQ